jgi:hypothetical protein
VNRPVALPLSTGDKSNNFHKSQTPNNSNQKNINTAKHKREALAKR